MEAAHREGLREKDGVVITLPSSYSQGTGDTVLFAMALIPEPSLTLLLLGAVPVDSLLAQILGDEGLANVEVDEDRIQTLDGRQGFPRPQPRPGSAPANQDGRG